MGWNISPSRLTKRAATASWTESAAPGWHFRQPNRTHCEGTNKLGFKRVQWYSPSQSSKFIKVQDPETHQRWLLSVSNNLISRYPNWLRTWKSICLKMKMYETVILPKTCHFNRECKDKSLDFRGTIIPYGSKYLLRKCLGYNLLSFGGLRWLKYLLRQCLDPEG